ncbi:E3 CR1-g [Human adenovirus 65]|uniref:E3 CR1-g n=1 Tax=Human adenovirus 65 TaxID=1094363 RepID=H0PPH1_9ADEN|nr:E3 CR1-g [Human adenovirus 65]
MKAFTACVLISLFTLSSAGYIQVNVTRGGNITLNGPLQNTTWLRYHLNGWQHICTWSGPSYKCHTNNGSITIFAINITSGTYKAEGYKKEVRTFSSKNQRHTIEDSGDYEEHKILLYNLTIFELPTTKAPTTVRTTRETTAQPTTNPTTQTTTSPTTQPTTITTREVTTHTTQLDTTVQNSTVLIRFLLREESTTEQTEATSIAFSSTANLTSLASINETIVPMMLEQDLRGLDMQITFLVVCGIFILAVLLYFVCCKAREKSRRPIYRPVIGEPQPLQVDGGLRNLLFSFTVW